MIDQNQRNKSRTLALWQALDSVPIGDLARLCRDELPAGFVWRGPAPYTALMGPEAFAEQYLAPLRRALPDGQRETHMFFGGASDGRVAGGGDGRMWVCGTGYLHGRQAAPFCTVPADSQSLRVRWGDFLRFDGCEIVEWHTMLDFADWFEQIGRPALPPSRGVAFVYPAPTAFDGRLIDAQEPHETAHTLALGRQLLFDKLNGFDQKNLGSMGMTSIFHPNIKWYGPGGIGACLSLREFQELHQKPWLVAYPDRRVQDLDALFAEGRLLGATGFAGVLATHTGPYLDAAATGKRVAFNGMDFWLRSGEQFTENWVFVDMPHLFAQFGIDLFDRMLHQVRTS